MGKVIDLKTGSEMKCPIMIKEWVAYADKHLGEAACVISYDKETKKLIYIAKDERMLITLIISAYEQFLAQGIIQRIEEEKSFKDIFMMGINKWKKLLKKSRKK